MTKRKDPNSPKGSHGGARVGAGRNPADPSIPRRAQPEKNEITDPDEFLAKVMRGELVPTIPQLDAAKLLSRNRAATNKVGKKQAKVDAAGNLVSAGPGRPRKERDLSPAAPPKPNLQ